MSTICISPKYTDKIMSDLIFKEYFEDVADCYNDIDRIFTEYYDSLNTIEAIEREVFELAGDKKEEPKGLNGLASKLGKAIRTLMQKLSEMFDKFFNRFTEEKNDFNDASARVQQALRDKPELKKQALDGLEKGLISPKEILELQNFDKEFNELMAVRDPQTFKQKFQALKIKFGNMDKSNIVKGVGAVAAVAGGITAVLKCGGEINKVMDNLKSNKVTNMKALTELQNMCNDAGVKAEDLGFFQQKVAAHQFASNEYANAYSTLAGKYSGICKFLDNFAAKAGYGRSGNAVTKAYANRLYGAATASDANSATRADNYVHAKGYDFITNTKRGKPSKPPKQPKPKKGSSK